jgi:uncharacterized protein YlxW (UPF0749 family)
VSDNVESATLEILKSIQASIARLESKVSQLDSKVDRLAAQVAKFLRDMAGTLVMMRATAGDFDRRVTEVEDRVAALEGETT